MKNNRGLAQIFPLIFLGATLVVAVGAVAFQNGAFKNLSKAGMSCLVLKTQDQCNAQSGTCEWKQVGSRYVCRGKKSLGADKSTTGEKRTDGLFGTDSTKTDNVDKSGAGTTTDGRTEGTMRITTNTSTCPAGAGWSGTACYQANCAPDEHYDYSHNDKCTFDGSKWVCKCGTGLSSLNSRCLQAGGSMSSGICWIKSICPADKVIKWSHYEKCKLNDSNYTCRCGVH